MKHHLLLLLLIVILPLTACDGGVLIITATPDAPSSITPAPFVTNTPTDEPTPTEEAATWTPSPPVWDVSCADGYAPINPVVCPSDYQIVIEDGVSQHVPVTMSLAIDPITNGYTVPPTLRVIDGKLHIDVSNYGGDICIQIPNIYMQGGHCYTFNTPLSFNFLGAANFGNYWFDSRVHTSTGQVADLNNHPVILTPGGRGVMVGHRPSAPGADDAVYWAFSPGNTTEVVWEFCYHATWASTGGSHWIDVEAFIIQEQFNTQICN